MMRALALALVLAGCGWRGEVRRAAEPFEPLPLAVERPVPTIDTTMVLTAEVRRAQVVQDIVALTWLSRHTLRQERLIALEVTLAERRAELDRLNAVIAGEAR